MDYTTLGLLALGFVICSAIPLGVILGFLLFIALRSMRGTGISAPAQVVSVAKGQNPTKLSIEVVLVLQVEPPGEEPFQVTVRKRVHHFDVPKVQPTRSLKVRYDPADLSTLVVQGVDWVD